MAFKSTQNRTIVLPIPEENYELFVQDSSIAHEYIKYYYSEMPECFPAEMEKGYQLNGRDRKSKKTKIQQRRIKLGDMIYRIRPSFILPYQRGRTEEASKGLFLLRFGVPFWALSYCFGHNPMWWYRLYLCLSVNSIVGTTVRESSNLPQDILADEHHIKIRGKKAYVATTVGNNCFLGMNVSSSADENSLYESYGVFKEEASDLNADYQPDTVNTDGWFATQNCWKHLYPAIYVIECFLHAFIKVRDRATKKLKSSFNTAADKIWNCYRADSKRALAQQIRRLKEWGQNMEDSAMKDNILKVCKKKKQWMMHFDVNNPHRTSNMIDRLMRAMKRHAYNSQMFHGKDTKSASKNFRAFALLYNFSPSSPNVTKNTSLTSPAARLNGFVYHQDWLQNLFISASLGGYYNQRNPL